MAVRISPIPQPGRFSEDKERHVGAERHTDLHESLSGKAEPRSSFTPRRTVAASRSHHQGGSHGNVLGDGDIDPRLPT